MPFILSLLLVASTVAAITRNIIRIPYTIALVVVGLIIGFTHLFESAHLPLSSLHLSKELILVLFVPPLLFEGALNMDLEILQRNALGVFLLAVLGTLLSTFLLGLFAHYVLGLDWAVALLFGAILSPTDPVSVLALFREQGVEKNLSIIVEGESIFNDGLGVVLYLILLQAAGGEVIAPGHAAQMFIWEVLIGASVGFAVGYLGYRLLGKIDDHLVEVTVSILLAFGSYVIADRFHASGIIAVVVTGIIIGSYGQIFSMSAGTRLALTHFWEVIAFVINSILFLLIGIDLESPDLLYHAKAIALVFIFTILTRFLFVFGFARFVSWVKSWRIVIVWGGLRGSIPIALTLGLPADFPHRQDFVTIIFGVVLLSLLVQGLTFKGLLRKLKIGRPSGEEEVRLEELFAHLMGTNAAIHALDRVRNEGILPLALYSMKIEPLQQQRQELEESLEVIFEKHPELKEFHLKRLEQDLARTRLAALDEGLRKGILREETAGQIAREIHESLVEQDSGEKNAKSDKK